MVKTKPNWIICLFPIANAQWDHVNVTPDDKSSIVLKKGSPQAFITSIPFGGQTPPIQIYWDILE